MPVRLISAKKILFPHLLQEYITIEKDPQCSELKIFDEEGVKDSRLMARM